MGTQEVERHDQPVPQPTPQTNALRVYACEGDYQPVMEPLLVKIDMGELH